MRKVSILAVVLCVVIGIAAIPQTSMTYSTANLGLRPPTNANSFQPLWALCATTKTVQVKEFRVSGDMAVGSGDVQFSLALNPNGLAVGTPPIVYAAWKMDSAETAPVSTVYVWTTKTPPMLSSLTGWNYFKNQDVQLDGKPYALYQWNGIGKPITVHQGECLHLLLTDVPPNVNYILLDSEFTED